MTTPFPTPPYRLRTERLLLRCWDPGDAEALCRVTQENRERLAEWMPWAVEVPTPTGTLALLRRFRADFDAGLDLAFGLFLHDVPEPIGGLGLHPRVGPGGLEVGYWTAAGHTRQGYATEAAGTLTRAGLELCGADRVEMRIQPENVASLGVAHALGFTREASLRRRLAWPDGSWRDQLVFTLFADQLAGSPAASVHYEALDASGRPLPPRRSP